MLFLFLQLILAQGQDKIYFDAGIEHYLRGNYQQAVWYLEESLKINPDNKVNVIGNSLMTVT